MVSACTSVALSIGLLPPHTLFWKQQANQVMLGIYVLAQRWKVQCDSLPGYRVPMPPLVFVGCGSSYHVLAVKKRPLSETALLYHAPCPNVYADGSICQGDTPFSTCSPQNIQTALMLFLEGSLFNGNLSRGKCVSHPEDVRALWAELDGHKRFPLSELTPAQKTIHSLL